MSEKIVSIGLLTERDLDVLGAGFQRHFPIVDDHLFDELMEKLSKLPPVKPRSEKPNG